MENIGGVVLIILDGWGLRAVEEGNAILQAKTPVIDTITAKQQSLITLQAAGEMVGLPWGETGNSEVGHINIGSGRVVLSDFTQIEAAIQEKTFFKNPVLIKAIENSKDKNSDLHIIGLASDSAIHGDYHQLMACVRFAVDKGLKPFIHLITDGRDTPPKVALDYIKMIQQEIKDIGGGTIVSVSGRFYSMDRDSRWDRTAAAYEAMVNGKGEIANTVEEAIEQSYEKGQTDEFILPTLIGEKHLIGNNDSVIFTNFRADRAIQLTKYFVDSTFNIYKRKFLSGLYFATMTQYQHGIGAHPMFSVVDLNNPKKNPLVNPLAQVISEAKLKQLHAAESEKYAHVTYFFNAGIEKPFAGEERIIVNSPKVTTYDLAPEMSAPKLTKEFINKWTEIKPAFSVINYANADMVGHTGNLKATIKAVECIDDQIYLLIKELLPQGVTLIITGDHGNGEELINPDTGTIDKEHSINPVPLLFVDKNIITDVSPGAFKTIAKNEKINFTMTQPVGLLADVAPTVLSILKLAQPKEMQGNSFWSGNE
jgi:2,3-bisphosphoglycerate-independent phosphoglycerate mutase